MLYDCQVAIRAHLSPYDNCQYWFFQPYIVTKVWGKVRGKLEITRNGVLLNKYDKERKIVEYCLEGVNITDHGISDR